MNFISVTNNMAKTTTSHKSKVNTAVEKAVSALLELRKAKVAFHLVVHAEGRTQSFGTKKASAQFDTVKEVFEHALLSDVVDMCNPAQEDPRILANNDNLAPKLKEKINRLNANPNELEKLPYPLRYMNRKEKLSYLRYLVQFDRQKRLQTKATRIVAGDESWEPSFWLKDDLEWKDLKKNLGYLKKEDLPNEESPNIFFSRLIANAFVLYGESTDLFVDESLSLSMIEKRKKLLGIHTAPRIIEDDDELNESTIIEEDDLDLNDDVNHDEEYIPPQIINPPGGISAPPPPSASIVTLNAPDPIHHDEEQGRYPDSDDYNDDFVLPVYLQQMIPKMEVKGITKYGQSLFQCVALKYDLEVDDLQAFSTKKLLGRWWVHFRKWFQFPMRILIENDIGERKRKCLEHQYELFDFLKTDDYKHAFKTGDAELEILSTIINQPIHILEFNRKGFPPGTKEEERCKMRSVEPKKGLLKEDNFVQTTDIFLLHNRETGYFHLLAEKIVPAGPEGDQSEEVETDLEQSENVTESRRTFIDNLESSLFPGESLNYQNSTLISEPQTNEHQDIEQHIIEPTKLPNGQKKQSSALYSSSSSFESSTSSLRRSTRISEKAKRAEREEVFKLIEPPSYSVREKDRIEALRIASFEKKRKLDDESNRKVMEAMEEESAKSKRLRMKERSEVERLQRMGAELRNGLSAENITEIFYDNLEYFMNIEHGIETSWRYTAFSAPGNAQRLRFRQIGAPFSDAQQDKVFDLVKGIWLKGKNMDPFVDNVICPEVFIRIYQVFFAISKSEAEKNIFNWEGSSDPNNSESDDNIFL